MTDNILSEPRRISIPILRMAKARRFGTEPEDEVIAYLRSWIRDRGADPLSGRSFGFDVPVGDSAPDIRGYEYWVQVPQNIVSGDDVTVEEFPGGDYLSLRITDPFADPFIRILAGWQALAKYIEDNGLDADFCSADSCLEEVLEIDGVCYMDVMARLK